jgi:predicted membrane protein
MSDSDIINLILDYDNIAKSIKDEIFRLSWYMRGGVSSYELFHVYGFEDRKIMNEIIKDNIDLTKSSGLPLL